LRERGEDARLCREHDDIESGAVAFYFGCVRITPPQVLSRNHRNLVIHASDLPNGRGFSPLTWKIIEGLNDIPVSLIEAVQEVDAGPIIYQDVIQYRGHELIDELRRVLGEKHVELALRFLGEEVPPCGDPQSGEGSLYRRRGPDDSALDPNRSIAEQFDLLRTVDNEKYPAFFELRGHRYKIAIEKMEEET